MPPVTRSTTRRIQQEAAQTLLQLAVPPPARTATQAAGAIRGLQRNLNRPIWANPARFAVNGASPASSRTFSDGLAAWARTGGMQENRAEAAQRIARWASQGDREETLNLAGLGLTALPAQLWQLTKLTGLILENNPLGTLSAQIGQLRALEYLSIDGCSLTSLPTEIGRLVKLHALEAGHCGLTTLPAQIGRLSLLEVLDLSENRLTLLPPEIGNLRQLEKLNLSGNHLTSLCAQIGQLKTLRILEVQNNRLSTLPDEIGELRALTTCSLTENHLRTLPTTIGRLQSLEYGFFAHNHLSRLPPDMASLQALLSLDLQHNRLASLPPAIEQMTALRSLDLRENALTSLPETVLQLHRDCTIEVDVDSLTPAVRNRIDAAMDAPGYIGPQVEWNLGDEMDIDVHPLKQEVAFWREQGEEPVTIDEQAWDRIEREDGALDNAHDPRAPGASRLAEFLGKLSMTSEYRTPIEELKADFIGRVNRLLERIERGGTQEFRTFCYVTAREYVDRCGDQKAVGLIGMESHAMIDQIELDIQRGHYDGRLQVLVDQCMGFWRLDKALAFAKDKVDTLNFCDPMEIYLGVVTTKVGPQDIPLAQKYGFPVKMNSMLYPHWSNLTPEDIEQLEQRLAGSDTDEYRSAQRDYLSHWAPVRIFLQRHGVDIDGAAPRIAAQTEILNERCQAELEAMERDHATALNGLRNGQRSLNTIEIAQRDEAIRALKSVHLREQKDLMARFNRDVQAMSTSMMFEQIHPLFERHGVRLA